MNLGKSSNPDLLSTPRYVAFLGLMIFVAFPDVLLGRGTFFFRDYEVFTYPLAFYQRQCFWEGELPLWDPYSFFGIPFLAQWNTITLYPPSLIYLLLPLPWSLNLFCLAHLFLGGTGMYKLALCWTNRTLAAAVAGTAFSFSGMALNALMWHSTSAGLAWMPWVVLWVERGCEKGGRTLVVGVILATLQMLAGSPEIIVFTWTVVACLIVVRLWQKSGEGWATVRRTAFIVLMVSGLAAVQLLPFFQCLHYSLRSLGHTPISYAMPSWGWLNLLVPAFRAWRHPAGVLCQPDQDYTTSYYIGIGTIWLALWAMLRVRSSRVVLLSLLFLFSLVLALGNHVPGFGWMMDRLPVLGLMRFPVKFTYLATFAGILLAAFGLADLEAFWLENPAGGQRVFLQLGLCLGLLLILVGSWAVLRPVHWENGFTTACNACGRVLMLGVFCLILHGFGRKSEIRWRHGLAWLLVGSVWLDAITHCPRQNPTVDPSLYRIGLFDTLNGIKDYPRLGEGRIYLRRHDLDSLNRLDLKDATTVMLSYRLSYCLNCPMLDGIPSCFGIYPLYLQTSAEIMSAIEQTANGEIPGLFDFVGIAWINTPGKCFDWVARPTHLPMITAGENPRFLADTEAMRLLGAAEFKPAETVLLPPEARYDLGSATFGKARVISPTLHANKLEFEVQTDSAQPTLTVIAQSYFPAWKAYVDGKPTRLWRANQAFQALAVPRGRHQVLVQYEDAWLHIGLLISGISILGLLLFLGVTSLRTDVTKTHAEPAGY